MMCDCPIHVVFHASGMKISAPCFAENGPSLPFYHGKKTLCKDENLPYRGVQAHVNLLRFGDR